MRPSARRRLLIRLILSSLVLQATFVADATETTRTAPYDFGCITWPPCSVEFEPARNGELVGSTVPTVCFWFFVVPVPCLSSKSTATGIHVDVETTSTIIVSAVVRGTSPADPGPLTPLACFALAQAQTGYGYYGYGCRSVASGSSTLITTTFENSWLSPGPYDLYVYLIRGPGSALVESISFQPPPPPPPPPMYSVSLTPAHSTAAAGEDVTLVASVTDDGGPVDDGTPVYFSTYGPQGATATSTASTTYNGEASYTFTSSEPGRSTVTAQAGASYGYAVVDWTAG